MTGTAVPEDRDDDHGSPAGYTHTQRISPPSFLPGAGGPTDEVAQRRELVVSALERLRRGVFARCDVCGDQIDDRRLRTAPQTSRCPRHRCSPA